MCFIFHKWGKWHEYTIDIPARNISKNYLLLPAIENRQRKICENCGKIEDKFIKQIVIN